ncbi:MAG: Trm112 family protein [Granulosicoccaceae bacterium]
MDKRLLDMLVCPVSKGKLIMNGNELWSSSSSLAYPVRDGIPVLLESEARALSPEEIETLTRLKKKSSRPLDG